MNATSIGRLPRIGLGTGNLASFGRSASKAEARALLAAVCAEGLGLVDTADTYGSGDCEILLGRALRDFSRSSFCLLTKAGYRFSNLPGPMRPLNPFLKKALHKAGRRQCFSPGYLSSCIDGSLRRLRCDVLDIFLLHDPPALAVTDEKVLGVLARAKAAGKILHSGVSTPETLVREAAEATCGYDILEVPAHLLALGNNAGPLGQAAGRGMWIVGNHVFAPDCLSMRGMTREILFKASLALLPERASLLVGTKNPAHWKQCLEWASSAISAEEAAALLKQVNHGEANAKNGDGRLSNS